ncbi:MAG: HU family DNA-binding protein [Deltaproteobacteria bacterium]|jgi:DNA-binding protein HU-beta|nr:HU family DNA-binding protein [Deltaproteobacteria bacterium]
MTKTELITQVALETGFSRPAVQKILESILSTSIISLKKDTRFQLFGLGVFQIVKRSKRKGRNPRTGEALTVKAHNAVRFKAAKVLKDSVNGIPPKAKAPAAKTKEAAKTGK